MWLITSSHMETMYVLHTITIFILIFMHIICFTTRVNSPLNVLTSALYSGCYSLRKHGTFIVLFLNAIRTKDFSLCHGMIWIFYFIVLSVFFGFMECNFIDSGQFACYWFFKDLLEAILRVYLAFKSIKTMFYNSFYR